MKRRTSRTVIAAIAVFGVVATATWIAVARSRPSFQEQNLRIARTAAKVFDQATPIRATERASVVNAILLATPIPEQPYTIEPPENVRNGLAEFVASWFEARADGDPETYARWAMGRGYQLSAEDPAWIDRKRPVLEWMWPGYSDGPFPATIDARSLFDTFYTGSMNQQDGVIRPHLLAGNPAIVFRLMRADMADSFPLPFEDHPDMMLWSNWETAGDMDHWRPSVTYSEVLSKHQEALTGIVQIAAKPENRDTWTPYTLACYYDPDTEQWHFLQVSTSNVTHPHVAIER